MSITIAQTVKLTPDAWRRKAERVIESIRNHVAKKQYFRGVKYNADYALSKADRKAAPKGVPQASTSGTPDLTLTGKMLKGLEVRQVDDKGFTIGWIGEDAAKVEYNANMGRAITTDSVPLIPPVEKELYADIDANFAKRVAQSKSTTNIDLKM